MVTPPDIEAQVLHYYLRVPVDREHPIQLIVNTDSGRS
jgi:hypothetical protein